MSIDLLLALPDAHAFDPFPVRDDLGAIGKQSSSARPATRTRLR